MHPKDFARLAEISSHGVLARSVRELTYHTTLYETPAGTFDEFKEDYKSKVWSYFREHPSDWNVRFSADSTLLSEYGKYLYVVAVQHQMDVNMADLTLLKDVIAKFTGLKNVTMSSENCFLRWPGRRTPFERPCKMLTEWPQPEGIRQLEVLLEALIHNKVKLDSLRAGTLRWEFFDKTTTELERLFQPTLNATQVELKITLGHVHGRKEDCRQLMKRGMLREILSRMKRLKSLRVGFSIDWKEHKPAMLKDIMSSSHHWPQLQQLKLCSVETDRRALMQLLRLHKDTLRILCLGHINLGGTSWEKFLPEIRNNLYLEEACIWGLLTGRTEGMPYEGLPESWRVRDADMMDSINCYCGKGGKNYPDEIPLTDEIVEKNLRYVSKGFR